MNFKQISESQKDKIIGIVGADNVCADAGKLDLFARDETEDLVYHAELVVSPDSVDAISELIKYCNSAHIPLTPRGGGTGLSGGALPIFGGVLLSLEKLNRIIEIDEASLQITVESGLITQDLINAVAEKGLYYPIDPSSKGSCFIGGNIAHGSGGPRVVKYGTIREYVLNLEVVLSDGTVIWTGANTLKNAAGYNLTQLFIGSEGTLGVVTKAVLKLLPLPAYTLVMMASFPSNESACEAVSAIFRAGITPSALEFMERQGIEWVIRYDHFDFDLNENETAFLMIEVDGSSQEHLLEDCERINQVLESYGCLNVLFADSAAQKEKIWRMRRLMPLSVKSNSIYKEEDTVVPRAKLPALIAGIKEIGNRYGFQTICYGHAGDGNLHVNIIKGTMSNLDWSTKLKSGIREIFELTVALGGTISGEHGIGLVQKEFMDIKYSATHLNLMAGIKNVFDPNGILNPGKIF